MPLVSILMALVQNCSAFTDAGTLSLLHDRVYHRVVAAGKLGRQHNTVIDLDKVSVNRKGEVITDVHYHALRWKN